MYQEDKFQKHLTLQDRYDIEESLNHGDTITIIAKRLGKDLSTISKEIKKHRIGDEGYSINRNDCMHRLYCQKKELCMNCQKVKRCSVCRSYDCRSLCTDYRTELCKNTIRAPHVCNGCHLIYECRKPHFFYRANVAYDTYKALLKDTREGISLSREELYELDSLITPLLKQGQSIAHIYAVHKEEIHCSMKSIYNYIDQGIFTARNIDLPKKVKYKVRKKRREESLTDYVYRINRTYKDFQTYMEEFPETNVVELDTVHGSNKAGKVILTFLFRNCNLMLIILMDECRQDCVKQAFDYLSNNLGLETFKQLFPVILTDNGSEFKCANELEVDQEGNKRCNVFYCDPLASWQKAKLEKNHEFIRKVLPKGVPLTDYTQEDMNLLMNHINSTTRASLNGRTPYELAQLLLHHDLIRVMNLKLIPADDILLKPLLLKK